MSTAGATVASLEVDGAASTGGVEEPAVFLFFRFFFLLVVEGEAVEGLAALSLTT
jgi:hypothetical protein